MCVFPAAIQRFFQCDTPRRIRRFSKYTDIILADLVHLQEQPSKIDPEKAPELLGSAILRDAVHWQRVHRVAVSLWVGAGNGGLRRSLLATQIVFNATGQEYRQKIFIAYFWAPSLKTKDRVGRD